MKKTPSRIRWLRVLIWTIAGLAIGAVSGRVWASLFVGAIFFFARLLGELSRPKPKPAAPKTPPLTEKMAVHYENSGLSDSEVDLFRETMDQASEQIQTFEAITRRVKKLGLIAANADLLEVLHAYFKAIVKNPKALAKAGHFIYEALPNLVNIAQKYEAISHHEVKTEDTYAVLTTAGNTIADMAQDIRKDYADFVETDIDDLEADLALANMQIKKVQQLREDTRPAGTRVDLKSASHPLNQEMEHSHE